MKRFVLLGLLAGCATTSGSTTPSQPIASGPAQPQKLAITNLIPFDVAACGPRALTLAPFTPEVLTGAMLSMTPAIQECFVNTSARDGQAFDLKAKVTVAEGGATVEVTGAGASPAGKGCVEAAYKKLPFPTLEAGSKPVVAEVPISGGAQTVKLGDNAANDIAGQLRLAQPALCECYASLGEKTPPMLKTTVDVDAEGKATVEVMGDDTLAACIKPKLEALPFAKAPTKLTWPFLLKNSYAGQLAAEAPAALRFQQLDGMRGQRTSDVLMASGQRVAAALAFDDLAQRYKKKPVKGMLEELKSRCAEVVAGDEKQIAAVKRLVDVLEESQKLVMAEKAKDPQWAQVEPMLAQAITSSTAEVVRVEEQKKNDLNACPKVKY